MKTMKIKLTIVLISVLLSGSLLSQNIPSEEPLYKLVFVDEFNNTTLDLNTWNTHVPWSPANHWNSPYHIHDNDTLDVPYMRPSIDTANWHYDTSGNGYVRMKYKRENCQGPVYVYENNQFVGVDTVDFKFSGGMMLSKEKFKYGYFEIKYRFTDPLGLISDSSYTNAYAPNFWLWNSRKKSLVEMPDAPFAYYSEIDIYETDGRTWQPDGNSHYSYNQPGWLSAHAWNNNSAYPYNPQKGEPVLPHQWHVMSCEWTTDYADFYYDNKLHRRFSDELCQIDSLIEMTIIIDNTMPAANYLIPYVENATIQPVYYDIDYVKVYQIEIDTIDCHPASNTRFRSKLYKSLTIGSDINTSINSSKQHLCATDYVILNSGFEYSGNCGLTISCKKCPQFQYHGLGDTIQPTDYGRIIEYFRNK